MKEESKINIYTFIVSLFIFLLGILWPAFYYISQASQTLPEKQAEETEKKEVEFINPFEKISLESKAAFVWDITKQNPLFEKNQDEVLPLASITKMVSALTALDTLTEETVINIEKEFILAEGNSGLYVDEKWRMKDLLDFSLMSSLNDGMKAIASVAGALSSNTDDFEMGREVFVSKMNQKVKEIGLSQSRFYNESGLDVDKNQSGGYGTAKEVALLFEYILKNRPEILESTNKSYDTFRSLTGIEHTARNTNIKVENIPGIIGSKTGFTELSGGNLAIVFDPAIGRPIVISVLGSSLEGRIKDTLTLSQKTLEYLSQEPMEVKINIQKEEND